jgi:hypothetical protein
VALQGAGADLGASGSAGSYSRQRRTKERPGQLDSDDVVSAATDLLEKKAAQHDASRKTATTRNHRHQRQDPPQIACAKVRRRNPKSVRRRKQMRHNSNLTPWPAIASKSSAKHSARPQRIKQAIEKACSGSTAGRNQDGSKYVPC